MKLKAPGFEIPPDDPFKHDLLKRRESAESLLEVVKSTDEPLVLCIDGAWGSGKTTFLSMWRQLLKNSGMPTMYFNAWENDFSDDAMISLIGEFEAGMEELALTGPRRKKARATMKKAKNLGVALTKHLVPAGIKIATAGAVNADALTRDVISGLTEKLATEQIQRYERSKKTVAAFKTAFGRFAAEVTTSNDKGHRCSLVVLVDELDRCRPTFAVEVLEKVKHFFNVPNVIFVIAIDKQQLRHSIRSLYGQAMDVDGYLKRFFDLDYSLPPPGRGRFSVALFDRFGLADFFKKRRGSVAAYDGRTLNGLFAQLFEILSCSLREQEQCFSQLSLAIRTTPENQQLYPVLLGSLIVLKAKNPELYRGFVTGESAPEDVLEYLRKKPGGDAFVDSWEGVSLEAYLVTCRSHRGSYGDIASPYRKVAEDLGAPEQDRKRATQIIEQIKAGDWNHNIQKYVVNKIDIVTQFEDTAG